jgi:hypothetical protein
VCKFAEHLQADPATANEDHLREYFLFLRQKKGYTAEVEAAELDDVGGFNAPTMEFA